MADDVVRVVKIGGSLFDLPQLGEQIQKWIDAQAPATHLLIAGGGPLADSIRQLDSMHAIGEEPAHWLCVRAMGVTARLLVDMLGDVALVDSLDEVRGLVASRPGRTAVFDPMPLLTNVEPTLPGVVLPHGWMVTSDSIAARVAEVLSAVELVLLKSGLPSEESPRRASAEHYVDPFFPTIAARLPAVRCVNLRSEGFAELTMR